MENNSATGQMNAELEEAFTGILRKFADRSGNNFKYLNYNGFTANFDESGVMLEWNVSARLGWKEQD